MPLAPQHGVTVECRAGPGREEPLELGKTPARWVLRSAETADDHSPQPRNDDHNQCRR